MNLRKTVLPVLALALAGCEPESGTDSITPDIRRSEWSTRPGEREIVAAEWDTILRLGGTETDTVFYRPWYIEAAGPELYLYDGGRYQVGRFTRKGERLWWYGSRGRGPDEFTNVRDIELDAAGNLWVLDPENARITVLMPEGAVADRIPLRNMPHSERVLPISGGNAVLLTTDTITPLVVIDPEGTVVDRMEHPWEGWQKLSPLASQSVAASDAMGTHFAVAFAAGNGFFVFHGLRAYSFFGAFVEHIDFPRIELRRRGNRQEQRLTRPVFSANSIDIDGDRLYVHFSGRTEHRHRLMDVYEVRTGRYLRSVVLPRGVNQIAVADGVVYALYETPYPALAAWRTAALD